MNTDLKQIQITKGLSEGWFRIHGLEPDVEEKAKAKVIGDVLKSAMDFVEIIKTDNPREVKAVLVILSDKPIKTEADNANGKGSRQDKRSPKVQKLSINSNLKWLWE